MRTIQINYDLRAPGRDYKSLHSYIKSFDGWCHLLESCWLVRTWQTAGDIRDNLKRHVDPNDKVATFDVTNVSWATNFTADTTTWLKRNVAA